MRLKTASIYLSIGPTASVPGRFNSLESVEFAPIAPRRFREALKAGFIDLGNNTYSWAKNGETVICGPVEYSADFTEDGEEAFAAAPLDIDAELTSFVELLEGVRKSAPDIWLAIEGEEEMFLPRAFAAAVNSGTLSLVNG